MSPTPSWASRDVLIPPFDPIALPATPEQDILEQHMQIAVYNHQRAGRLWNGLCKVTFRERPSRSYSTLDVAHKNKPLPQPVSSICLPQNNLSTEMALLIHSSPSELKETARAKTIPLPLLLLDSKSTSGQVWMRCCRYLHTHLAEHPRLANSQGSAEVVGGAAL